MENDNLDINKITEEQSDAEDVKFSFNFFNMPWDDRSDRSKIGVIALLTAVLVVTMALVINNLIIHYKDYYSQCRDISTEIDCNLAKFDEYPYTARIHLVSTNALICLGATVTKSSVLANELCIKSGAVRLRVGSSSDPRCKKGFAIELLEIIPHDGAITKKLVLLIALENMGECMKIVKVGLTLDTGKQLFIIGRPVRGGRVLSFQLATYHEIRNVSSDTSQGFNRNKTIVVKTYGNCPVRAGDLLVQNGRLFGLASTSVSRKEESEIVYFANLSAVKNELQAFEVNFVE